MNMTLIWCTAAALLGVLLAWALANRRLTALQAVHAKVLQELGASQARLRDLELQSARLTPLQAEVQQWRERSEQLSRQESAARADAAASKAESASISQHCEELQQAGHQQRKLVGELQAECRQLGEQLAELRSSQAAEARHHAEKMALLTEARNQLGLSFKSIANEIFEEKSRQFTQSSQDGITHLIKPLREQITDFKSRIEASIVSDGKERAVFGEQLRQLMDLNQQMSADAKNLTSALKGNNKVQGNWGEVILEQLLESAGLIRDQQFSVQPSYKAAAGKLLRPDVVLHLPDQHALVIDAKVSIVAYSGYMSAATEAERAACLAAHLASIRSHIDGLSIKEYQSIDALRSTDFVLLFIPVEPAFLLALTSDSSLWQYAWERNILLVSPSTLLSVTRMVAHLWRREQQNRNAEAIAERGRLLLDKLNSFLADMSKIDTQIKALRTTYDGAFSKLSSGSGNLVRQAEKLVALGVKPAKPLCLESTTE